MFTIAKCNLSKENTHYLTEKCWEDSAVNIELFRYIWHKVESVQRTMKSEDYQSCETALSVAGYVSSKMMA